MANPRKRRKSGGRISLAIIMLFVVVAMLVATINVYQKKQAYAAEEKALEEELDNQKDIAEDLKDYEAYTKTDEYVENTAKSKLGLVYQDEIIFRQQ